MDNANNFCLIFLLLPFELCRLCGGSIELKRSDPCLNNTKMVHFENMHVEIESNAEYWVPMLPPEQHYSATEMNICAGHLISM